MVKAPIKSVRLNSVSPCFQRHFSNISVTAHIFIYVLYSRTLNRIITEHLHEKHTCTMYINPLSDDKVSDPFIMIAFPDKLD